MKFAIQMAGLTVLALLGACTLAVIITMNVL